MTSSGRLVVAIGDLHGHYPALDRLLSALERRYRLFRSTSAKALREGVTLVFTGDYIDRGTSGLEVVGRIRDLQKSSHGQVKALFGNHELLALEHLDQARALAASPPDYPMAEYERNTHGRNGGDEFVREFGSTPTSALQNYVKRMKRDGDVGRWLRGLRSHWETTVAGKRFLFLHADLAEGLEDRAALRSALDRFDCVRRQTSSAAGGTKLKWGIDTVEHLFWRRDFSRFAGAESSAPAAVCRRAGVDYIVTGHSVHPEITVYAGRIFDIDVGMTPFYGENLPQALVVNSTGVFGFAADGTEWELARFAGRA